MSLEELRAKREKLNRNVDITMRNIETIAKESERVANVAHNSKKILDDLDREFELQTGLKGKDITFLFAAVGLQLARIYIFNEITKTEKAGQGNKKEEKLGSSPNLVGNRYSYHRFQGGIVVVKQRYVKGAMLHFVETLDIPLLHNCWVPKESMDRVAMPLP